jgi:hypothetical protein
MAWIRRRLGVVVFKDICIQSNNQLITLKTDLPTNFALATNYESVTGSKYPTDKSMPPTKIYRQPLWASRHK